MIEFFPLVENLKFLDGRASLRLGKNFFINEVIFPFGFVSLLNCFVLKKACRVDGFTVFKIPFMLEIYFLLKSRNKFM